MKPIKLNLHSFVDVITNSSTEIYSYVSGNLELVYEMIDEIIKAAGGTGSARDLFEVKEVPFDLGCVAEYAAEDPSFIEKYPEYKEMMDRKDWESFLMENDRWKEVNTEDSWTGIDRNETTIEVREKNTGEVSKIITEALTDMFYHEACYNG